MMKERLCNLMKERQPEKCPMLHMLWMHMRKPSYNTDDSAKIVFDALIAMSELIQRQQDRIIGLCSTSPISPTVEDNSTKAVGVMPPAQCFFLQKLL